MSAQASDRLGGLINEVLEVRSEEHRLGGFRFGELNPVGQLLLVAVAGRSELELGGRTFPLIPGTVAWLREAEWLRILVVKTPWTLLRVRFTTGALPEHAAQARIKNLGSKSLRIARELASAWAGRPSTSRTLLIHGLAEQLLGHLLANAPEVAAQAGEAASPWWKAETEVRRDLARTYTLAELCTLAGTNRVVLEESARLATGLTPIRRIRQIRLLHAQTLMRNSNLLLKEVAVATGYGRLHEFSRDYRRQFGLSPHKHRTQGYPDRPEGK